MWGILPLHFFDRFPDGEFFDSLNVSLKALVMERQLSEHDEGQNVIRSPISV
jgi:hypothetical protein